MAKKREEFNAMNKKQLDSWIKDEKNAASQYMEMAKEVYEKRFPAATTTKTDSKSKGKDEKISPVKTLSPEELANIDLQVELEEEKELYHKQQVELKELFASGRDENLQSEAEYNEALEQLAMMHLERMLDIAGLDADQRRSIEEQLLEFKVKCMQDELAERERLENEKVRNEELNASKQQAAFQKRVQTYLNYGEQVGNALGDIISGQEDAMEGFADSLVDIVFDVLTQIINAELIKLTGIGLSTTAEATAKQIASKGYAGIATGAALAAVITAGISAAKSTLKGLIGKRKDSGSTTSESSSTTYQRVAKGLESGGSIDIVRSQDGKKFPSAVYAPDKRGYINRPTVIVGDGPVGQSREWVASNAAVNNPTVAPILDLIDHSQQAGTIRTLDLNQAIRSRLIGYSSGGTITNHPITTMSSNKSDETSSPVLERFVQVIEKLERNGIPASVVLTELDRKQKLRDRSRKLGSK